MGDRGPRLSRGSLLIGLDMPVGWGAAGEGRAEHTSLFCEGRRNLLERGSPSAARETGKRLGPTSMPHPGSEEILRLPRSLLWVGLPLGSQELAPDLRERDCKTQSTVSSVNLTESQHRAALHRDRSEREGPKDGEAVSPRHWNHGKASAPQRWPWRLSRLRGLGWPSSGLGS